MDIRDMVPWNRRRRDVPATREGEEPFHALQRSFNDMFEDMWRRMGSFGWPVERHVFSPRVDVTEDDDKVTVTAELPGMDEKDIDVQLTRESLSIRGEKKQEHEERKRDSYHLERSYGEFRRTVPLPVEVDTEKADASFRNGVLTVHLPKAPEVKEHTRRISVKTG